LKKGNLDEDELLELLQMISNKIHFVNEMLVSTENIIQAFRLCKDVDEKDIPFVALTLELNGLLWTKDDRLKSHLKSKGFNQFFEI
jgi:predicted nucleic acid-binding protein